MWEIMVGLLAIAVLLSLVQIFTAKPKVNKVKRVNIHSEEQKARYKRINQREERIIHLWQDAFCYPRTYAQVYDLYGWQCTVCGRIFYRQTYARYCRHTKHQYWLQKLLGEKVEYRKIKESDQE